MEGNAGITPNFSVAAALHTWALPCVKEPLLHSSFPNRSHNEAMAQDVWSHEQVYDLTTKLGEIVSDIYPVLGVGKTIQAQVKQKAVKKMGLAQMLTES